MRPSYWRMSQICSHSVSVTQAWKSPSPLYLCRGRRRTGQIALCTHSTPQLKRKPLSPPPDLPPFVDPGAKDLPFTTWDNVAVLVDKPGKWTSNDVCSKLKFAVGRKWKKGTKSKPHKVGHAGTLDPMATGEAQVNIGCRHGCACSFTSWTA